MVSVPGDQNGDLDMKRISLVLASALMLTSASAAFATDTGGVKINGYVENDVHAGRNTNTADGSDARAYQSIGTIHSGTVVDGSLYNTVNAHDNDNLADGSDAVACQAIGSIGEFAPCQE